MKKVLLTAMALLTIASASVFGMYGKGDGWIDFLVHGNQFRARMDRIGFVLGNDTIKGTFGLYDNEGYLGTILDSSQTSAEFKPTLSAGIGYTSDVIGVGVGYNFTYINKNLQVHTPVLMINALNNNLRISAPIQVAVTDKLNGVTGYKYTGVAFDNIQLRYYTGIDAFNAIRLYAFYRNNSSDNGVTKQSSEALGFQARFYFLNTQVGDVTVNPFIRVEYHTALKGGVAADPNDTYKYTAENTAVSYISDTQKQSDIYAANPFKFAIKPVLSLAANSDFVSLYLEPSIGYELSGDAPLKVTGAKQKLTHKLTWGAYGEIYITPVKDLEWYFEADISGDTVVPVKLAASTGITWYLPAL
ncbi:cell surface protein [Brachyspira pilosicoli]|uniref:cell surface protein n=1 Tax=Brachyspira pilosicoli TaxID=52584 RepID=UPI0012F4B06A|nr:cell surface protein [Brachyspira pilosicoli]